MKPSRFVALLLLAFVFGSGSAEVALETGRALKRVRAERATGSAGDLVAVELHDEVGDVIARPRLIAPLGRAARLVLRDPANPELVRLALRIEAAREPSGDVALAYELELPGHALAASGRVWVTPGVEQPLDLGDAAVTATLLTLPVPSAAFDAYVEAQSARQPPPNPI